MVGGNRGERWIRRAVWERAVKRGPALGAGFTALVAGLFAAGCKGVGGGSSFEVLGAPEGIFAPATSADAVKETGERIDYIPLRARGRLAEPAYPVQALAAGVGDCTVYAAVTFDEWGRMTEVAPSLRRIVVRNAFFDIFLEEIETAVSTWELSAARQVYYERGPDGTERYVRTEPVAATVEIRFDFRAKEGMR